MTEAEKLAHFISQVSYSDLSAEIIDALKIRLLDSLGCAIGALEAEPIKKVRDYVDQMGGKPIVTLIGGGTTAPDRAAFYNSALVRYLDFNDSFLAKKETCHPSDNIAAMLSATEYIQGSGRDLLLAIAIAYQVQCQLSEIAPVRDLGFDHTVQGSFALASGLAKALKLSEQATAHAIAITAVAHNSLRVTRTGTLSHWKGLAYPEIAFCAMHSTLLAKNGITGPLEVIEGHKGFQETIVGPFDTEWKSLDMVCRTSLKKYNAEIHSQSTLEAALELKRRHAIQTPEIVKIEISIFDVAYHIIGGGKEGNKKKIATKEQADHSLPYLVAVALLDGEVTPHQFAQSRILQDDVQQLLQKVYVKEESSFSDCFPNQMKTLLTIHTIHNSYSLEKSDYEGMWSHPFSWQETKKKFFSLASKWPEKRCQALCAVIENIEEVQIYELTRILQAI